MECDKMHACIEMRLKNTEINVPADYISVCAKARKHPNPFSVQYVDHTFFKNFGNLSKYKSIRPGKIAAHPKVTDIKCLKYDMNGH